MQDRPRAGGESPCPEVFNGPDKALSILLQLCRWSCSEQGAGDGRCPSQPLAFCESSLHVIQSPAPRSPSSLSLPSACKEDVKLVLAVMVLLASRPPEVLPRLFPASSQRTLTPAQLLSYRNMFPSNLIEASFQQVSSPSSTTTGGWDGAGLQRRLLSLSGDSSPPTTWTQAPSLPSASLPTLPAPRLLSAHPRAGTQSREGAGVDSEGHPCLPSAWEGSCTTAAQCLFPRTLLLCRGFPVPGDQGAEAEGWAGSRRGEGKLEGKVGVDEGETLRRGHVGWRGEGKMSKLTALGKHL